MIRQIEGVDAMKKTKTWLVPLIMVLVIAVVIAIAVVVKIRNKAQTGQENGSATPTHYELINDTVIDDEYFSMQVPEALVGKVGYQVSYQETVSGDSVISVVFVLDELAETEPVEGNEGLVRLTDTTIGALYWINWRGLREYETEGAFVAADFAKLLLEAGEVNFEKMDEIGRREYGLGPEGEPICFNEDRTGAYCMDHPTDVQYTTETEDSYFACSELLAEALSTFRAQIFPYDTLDTKPYEELLESLQTQE